MYQSFIRIQLVVSKFLIKVQRRQVSYLNKKIAKISIFSHKICGFFKTLNGKSFTMPFSNMYQSFIRIQLLVLKFLIKVQRRQVSVFHKNLPKCQFFHTKFMDFFKL